MFKIFFENLNFSQEKYSNMISWNAGGEVGSTSPPGGNQVDGLPPALSFGCFFVQVDEFVHDEMLSLVFFPESLTKKKTRKLFGYSFP